jgi:hypothetical protein
VLNVVERAYASRKQTGEFWVTKQAERRRKAKRDKDVERRLDSTRLDLTGRIRGSIIQSRGKATGQNREVRVRPDRASKDYREYGRNDARDEASYDVEK